MTHNDYSLHIFTGEEDDGFYENRHHHRYEATPYGALDLLFSELTLHPSDRLVDVGCGKGRTLFFAIERFGCTGTGIEMDPGFYRECLLNQESFEEAFPAVEGNIDFYNGLADDYPISEEDTVFYFFNPFSIELFRNFVYRLMDSYAANPRELKIILYYPSTEYVHFLSMETSFEEIEYIQWDKADAREVFLVYTYETYEER